MGEDSPTKRRDVLRTVGTTVATAGGASVTAAGRSGGAIDDSRRTELIKRFQSPSDTREFIRSHAEPVVSYLTQHGYMSDLPGVSVATAEGTDGSQRGVVKPAGEDGDVGARVQLNISESEHTITLHATEAGQSHAVVTPEDGNPFVIAQRGDDVEPQRFCRRDGSICVSNFTCGDVQVNEYERIVCTDGDCFKGDDLGCGMPLFIDCKRC